MGTRAEMKEMKVGEGQMNRNFKRGKNDSN